MPSRSGEERGIEGRQSANVSSGQYHLQVLDVIQPPELLVQPGDAITDFFHLEDGDRGLSLTPSPQCKRESGKRPGSWEAHREGQLEGTQGGAADL